MAWLVSIQKLVSVIENIKGPKEKNHVIISVDAEKAFNHTQDQYVIKTQQTWLEGNFLKLIKGIKTHTHTPK